MVVEIDVPNVRFLTAAVFGLDELQLVEMLDELLDVLPAGLLDVVELSLLSRVNGEVRGDQAGYEDRRRDR